MNKKLLLKGILFWFVLAVLANLNGLIREFVYKLFLNDFWARFLNTLDLVAIIFVVTYFGFRKISKDYSKEAMLYLGIFWVILTLSFEFIFGHYVFGKSWDVLLYDYNVLAGRIWVLVIFSMLFAPYLIKKFEEKVNMK